MFPSSVLVCRRFNEAVNNYFSSHTIQIVNNLYNPFSYHTRHHSDIPLDKLLYNCPKITRIRISDLFCVVSSSVKNMQPFTHLLQLEIKHSTSLSKYKLQTFLKHCPNLESLRFISFITLPDQFDFSCLSKSIKHFQSTGIYYQPFKNLLKNRGFCLLSLDVGYFQMTRKSQINEIMYLISKHCSNLQVLRMGCTERITIFSATKLSWLRAVILFNQKEVSHELVEKMFKSLPELRTIDLDIPRSPSIEKLIKYCAHYCTNIESVNSRNDKTRFLSPQGLENWKSLKNLKSVNNRSFEYYESMLRD